jgi:predicted site-specific integrase-resolvase
MKIADVAKQTGWSESTLLRWCKNGLIVGAYQEGLTQQGRWRIPAHVVEKIIRNPPESIIPNAPASPSNIAQAET